MGFYLFQFLVPPYAYIFQFPLWDSKFANLLVIFACLHFQFPLWDSLTYIKKSKRTMLNFQFPLWDSLAVYFFNLGYTESFNSLYGIRFNSSVLSNFTNHLSIPFMGFQAVPNIGAVVGILALSIPFMGFIITSIQ